MFRLVIFILLLIAFFCRLSFQINQQRQRQTVKARLMSNISMSLYWLFQGFIPFDIIKNEKEWDEIIGAEEVEIFAWD
ncbi:uncharacterized protein LOC127010625 [Drosophila biarmipes]|uniref:uncharacterized protein LOC127010625 n=1 Tax=Drosophila biarmipes TaxID=125945 RepID=UPI0007E74514|nr:uncharacterized protein LOC127010625 [Drosophila biarmipes]